MGRLRPATAALLLAIAVGACLPASIRPTPPPTPLPSPTQTTLPTPPPTTALPTPSPSPTVVEYRIKRGDTLLTIAKRFGTSGRSIAYWNRERYPSLDPETAGYAPDRIQVGWVLRILPGQEYVPPIDDGETGIDVTPSPDDTEDYESLPPSETP
jgi:nucleoid-associated protein YgaU